MPTIIRSAASDEDVYEIAAFIARDSLAAALKLIDTFDRKLRLLAESHTSARCGKTLRPRCGAFP